MLSVATGVFIGTFLSECFTEKRWLKAVILATLCSLVLAAQHDPQARFDIKVFSNYLLMTFLIGVAIAYFRKNAADDTDHSAS
jgi:small basic protein